MPATAAVEADAGMPAAEAAAAPVQTEQRLMPATAVVEADAGMSEAAADWLHAAAEDAVP
jgi:hypothetical protein